MAEVIRLNPAEDVPQSTYSVEAEQQVLGALLLHNDLVGPVVEAGGASLFYDPVHRDLFEKIRGMERDGILASPVTLREWAAEHENAAELGGARYLARLAGASVTPKHIRDYAQHLGELALRRSILEATDTARAELIRGEEAGAHIAARLEAAICNVDGGQRTGLVSMHRATHDAIEGAMKARAGEDDGKIETGVPALDSMIGGMHPGEFILLGGRPSMGKSALSINIAINAARRGHGVAFCSLEMMPDAIAIRAISEEMGERGVNLPYRDIRGGQWQDAQAEALRTAAATVADLPIYMLPREYADIGALMAGAKRAKAMLGGNLKLLVVDYVQLMRDQKTKNRYELITEVSTALKLLAGRLGVPVLALSQLSRNVEQRDDKRPMLSDLRESGQLEQDADTVMFCYRDEYYIEREKPPENELESLADWHSALDLSRNRLEIIVAKQRQGPIGTAHVMCDVACNRVWDAQWGRG